jgi:uncharacterized membrane protein YgaE (UPF0421/DUF939 family)
MYKPTMKQSTKTMRVMKQYGHMKRAFNNKRLMANLLGASVSFISGSTFCLYTPIGCIIFGIVILIRSCRTPC